MDQEKRKVIIREIEQWQRSKLLPDQYCDFLLNLYVDAEADREPANFSGRAVKAIGLASWRQWLLVFVIFAVIFFVALYFSVFHPVLQIALISTSIILFLFFGQRYRSTNEAGGLALIGTGMLVMLGMGLYMLSLHGIEQWGWRVALLAFCALIWIILGIVMRIPLLHLCGWIAIFLVYASLLAHNMDEPQWYEVQLYWLPAAFVFCWCSWFFQRWSKPVAAVIFVAGVIIWFMPELYTNFFIADGAGLQLQLLAKIAAGGLLLFTLRKKWIAWVA